MLAEASVGNRMNAGEKRTFDPRSACANNLMKHNIFGRRHVIQDRGGMDEHILGDTQSFVRDTSGRRILVAGCYGFVDVVFPNCYLIN